MVLCMCVISVCFVFSIFLRARESWLRELTTLPGDLCSISSTHMWLTTIYSANLRGPETLPFLVSEHM